MVHREEEQVLREYRVGDIVHFEDAKLGRKEAQRLGELGFTVYLTHFVHGACDLWVYDYLPPATRDAEGFYTEDEALRMRLLRELRKLPYARTGKTVEACYPILLTEEDRAESQDVLGFARGLWCANQPFYDKNYGYISAEVLLYTSLFAAFRTVHAGFSIYGYEYPITRKMWARMGEAVAAHGNICRHAYAELDAWIKREEATGDVLMTVLCI